MKQLFCPVLFLAQDFFRLSLITSLTQISLKGSKHMTYEVRMVVEADFDEVVSVNYDSSVIFFMT